MRDGDCDRMTEPLKITVESVEGRVVMRGDNAGGGGTCCCKECPPLDGVTLRYSGGPSGTEYHCCDCAVFKCYADDVFLGDVDLNNLSGCPDRAVTITISPEKAQQIIGQRSETSASADCCTLSVRLECNTGVLLESQCGTPVLCHTSAADLEVRSKGGKLLFLGQCYEEPVAINLCKEIREVYVCDESQGCKLVRSETVEGYETLEECQSACEPYYDCTNGGCALARYSNVAIEGLYAGLENCEAVCLERYACDTWYGCLYINHAISGDTLEQCMASCVVRSYDCKNSGCTPRYDENGEFQSLAGCESQCVERYSCYNLDFCYSLGFGTSGTTQAECEQTCVAKSYDCTNDGCNPLSDTSGAFETRAECEAACVMRYECLPASACVPVGYSAATGDTLEECVATCVYAYSCNQRFDGEVNNSWCAPIGFQKNGLTLQDCCATEPCASSSNCVGFAQQNLIMPLASVPAVTVAESSAQPQEQSPTFGGLQRCGPRTEQTIAIQAGLPSGDIGEAIVPTDIFVGTAPVPQSYIQFVGGSADARRPPLTLEEQSPFGAGTFLSKMLEKIGIRSSPTCSCKARARVMNEKGNDWCEENIETIVGWLRDEAGKRRLPFVDFAGRLLVKRAIKLSRDAMRSRGGENATP